MSYVYQLGDVQAPKAKKDQPVSASSAPKAPVYQASAAPKTPVVQAPKAPKAPSAPKAPVTTTKAPASAQDTQKAFTLWSAKNSSPSETTSEDVAEFEYELSPPAPEEEPAWKKMILPIAIIGGIGLIAFLLLRKK